MVRTAHTPSFFHFTVYWCVYCDNNFVIIPAWHCRHRFLHTGILFLASEPDGETPAEDCTWLPDAAIWSVQAMAGVRICLIALALLTCVLA